MHCVEGFQSQTELGKWNNRREKQEWISQKDDICTVTDRTCCGYAVLFWMCREDECKEDFSSVFGKYAESNFFSKPCGAGNSDV